jgi:hypothetical protein
MVQRHKYLFLSPRGFGNETIIYRVAPHSEQAAARLIEKYEADPNGECNWITRRGAEAYMRSNRRATRELKRAGMNLYNNPVGASEISDFDFRER